MQRNFCQPISVEIKVLDTEKYVSGFCKKILKRLPWIFAYEFLSQRERMVMISPLVLARRHRRVKSGTGKMIEMCIRVG